MAHRATFSIVVLSVFQPFLGWTFTPSLRPCQQRHLLHEFTHPTTSTTIKFNEVPSQNHRPCALPFIFHIGRFVDSRSTRHVRYGSLHESGETDRDDLLNDTSKINTTTVKQINDAYQRFQTDLDSLPILITRQNHMSIKKESYRQKRRSTQQGENEARNDLRYIFQTTPQLVSLYLSTSANKDSHDQDIWPLKEFISIVGPQCRNHVLDMILRHPILVASILTRPKYLKSIIDICSLYLEMSNKEAQKVFNRLPISTKQRIDRQRLRQLFNYFLAIGETPTISAHVMVLSRQELGQIVTKFPQILLYRHENIHSTLLYLHSLTFVETNDDGPNSRNIRSTSPSCSAALTKMIIKRPSIVACGVDTRLKPIVKFLRDDLGTTSWKRIIVQYPQVFQCSVSSLPTKANFLEEILCLQRSWLDVSTVISGFPPLLCLSKENIIKKVSFLKKELDLDDDELRNICVAYPQLLGLSVDRNLRPKIDFFLRPSDHNNGAGLERHELRFFVSYQPSILGYSLDGRIRPRIQSLHQNSISFNYAPPYLMSLSDEKFKKWLNTQISTWSIQ